MKNRKSQFIYSERSKVGGSCDFSNSSDSLRFTFPHSFKKSKSSFINLIPYFWTLIGLLIFFALFKALSTDHKLRDNNGEVVNNYNGDPCDNRFACIQSNGDGFGA